MGYLNTLKHVYRHAARRGDRTIRSATASVRSLPDFLIVGAPKSGTTSLFHYLSQHPNSLPAEPKEIKFFDDHWHRGMNWYRSHFAPAWCEGVRFEGSATYLALPDVPDRIKSVLPGVRIIVLLREPMARTWSHYQHNRRVGREKRTFEEAVRQEMLAAETNEWAPIQGDDIPFAACLRFSLYDEQVERYFNVFGRDRVLVLRAEDMFTDTQAVVEDACDFVGLPRFRPTSTLAENVGSYEQNMPMHDELRAFFAPRNERLFRLLRSSPWW